MMMSNITLESNPPWIMSNIILKSNLWIMSNIILESNPWMMSNIAFSELNPWMRMSNIILKSNLWMMSNIIFRIESFDNGRHTTNLPTGSVKGERPPPERKVVSSSHS